MRKSAENMNASANNNNIANGMPFPILPGSNNQDDGGFMPNIGTGYKHPMTAMGTGFGGGG